VAEPMPVGSAPRFRRVDFKTSAALVTHHPELVFTASLNHRLAA
jgi:hypothetical protein